MKKLIVTLALLPLAALANDEKYNIEKKAGEKVEKFESTLSGSEFDKAFLTATVEGCDRFIPVLEGAKGKWDDKAFDRVLNRAIESLKDAQWQAYKLRGEETKPAS